jgi:hypothetical protein
MVKVRSGTNADVAIGSQAPDSHQLSVATRHVAWTSSLLACARLVIKEAHGGIPLRKRFRKPGEGLQPFSLVLMTPS